MTWTTIELAVTTPVFNGDDAVGVRVSSLRGAMRHWFRALAGTYYGGRIEDLARAEAAVFGSLDAPARVRMRIADPGQATWTPNPAFLPAVEEKNRSGVDGTARWYNQWVSYLLGMGLSSYDKQKKHMCLTRPYLEERSKIQLRVALPERGEHAEEIGALTLASLWLLCAYGGVGARTRRGFGGLRITGCEGELPRPWTPQTLRTPGLDFYESLSSLSPEPAGGAPEEAAPYFAALVGSRDGLARVAPRGAAAGPGEERGAGRGEPPAYPVLDEEHTLAGVSAAQRDSWADMAAHTGEQFRHARASEHHPNATYRPAIKTPEYLKIVNDRMRRGSEFDLAAFGLPIQFKQGAYQVLPQVGGKEARRASPLWLRFVSDEDGQRWRLFSFAFLNEFLPGPPGSKKVMLHAKGNGRPTELTVSDSAVRKRVGKWIDRMGKMEKPYTET